MRAVPVATLCCGRAIRGGPLHLFRHNAVLQRLWSLVRPAPSGHRSVKSLFGDVHLDRSAQARQRSYPLPLKTCVIYFTPRSGSSWLSDILARTRCIGHANEVFNPELLPKFAQTVQADTLPDYIDLIQRRLNARGVFSFEITWHQMQAVFGDGAAFMTHFKTAESVWLVRRDIVAQAVSLAKMVSTRIAHTPQTDEDARAAAEHAFSYDPELIRHWLMHIFQAEQGTEAHFARHGLQPMRIDYESATTAGAEAIIAAFARHLGVEVPARPVMQSPHVKLGTAQNALFAERFRDEQAVWLAGIEAERAAWVCRLAPLGPDRP